jgi:hypothetical protein
MRIIAREIALDIHDLGDILKTYKLDAETWDRLRTNHQFDTMLREAIEHWNSALTTRERVELKAQALVEENLITAQEMMVDKTEPASARVEMLKTIARIAKIGERELAGVDAGQRVSITINMGDKKLSMEKDVTPPGNLIEGEAHG